MSDEAMEDLIVLQNRLIKDMKRAIADGVLSEHDKAYITKRTAELRNYIGTKGNLTTEEEQILNKIETTYNLINRIEKDYLNQYINYLKK